MIFFNLQIDNPWFKPRDDFENQHHYHKDVKLSQHKNLEIQVSRFEPSLILGIKIDLRWRGRDHQGPEIDLTLLGYMFNVKIYDSRHWNYDEHRWMTDKEAADRAYDW
jgi:hypothetical protein